MRAYNIQGAEVWLLSIGELAKSGGLKVRTLREWERAGKLPRPVIVKKESNKISENCRRRLYLLDQAKVFASWVNKHKPGRGRELGDNVFSELHTEWDKVTQKFLREMKERKANGK